MTLNRLSFFLLTLLIFGGKIIFAQNAPSARAASLGGSYVALQDVWSVFHNQAGLANLEAISAGVYFENRFLVKELGDKGFALGIPTGNGAFGLSYRSFGYSAFSDSRAGLAYAMRLSNNFSIGVQANYHTLRIAEGYGNQSSVTIEAGFQYIMNSHLTIAGHLFNPTRSKLVEYSDERIPTIIKAGAAYRFSDKVVMTAEMRKASDKEVRINGGIEYYVVPTFALRAGFASNPALMTFGFGGIFNQWRLDMSASYHQVLGFTPQFSLSYVTSKEK